MISWIKRLFKKKTVSPEAAVKKSAYALVVHDTTLSGTGVAGDPLSVINGGGGGTVQTDNTLKGDGSASSLLGINAPFYLENSSTYFAMYSYSGIRAVNGTAETRFRAEGAQIAYGSYTIDVLGNKIELQGPASALKVLNLDPLPNTNNMQYVLTYGDFNSNHFSVVSNKVSITSPFNSSDYYTKNDIDTGWLIKSITAGNGISASTSSGVATIATNLSAGNGVTISSAAARVIAAPHTAGNGITITQSAGASTTIATNFTAGPGISISAAANRVFKSELGSDNYSGITITQGANGAAHKVALNLESGTGIRIDNGSSGTAKKISSTVSGMTEVYHDGTLKGNGTSQTSSNALGLNFVNTFQDITTTDKAQIFEAGEYDYATLTDCYGTRNAQNAYIIARWESFVPVATQNKVGLQIKHKSKWLPTEYLGPISSSENSSWCCPFTYYVKDSSTYYYEAWLAGIGRWSTSNGKFYILAYDQPYIGLIFEQLTPPVRIEIHMRYIVDASYRDV